MATRCLVALIGLAACGAAEIIDRIAVTLDNRVVTESDLVREIRLTAFLNGAPSNFSGAEKRKAAERLVERALMERDMELSRYSSPDPKEAAALLDRIRKERFPGEAAYQQALQSGGILEQDLRSFLLAQLTTLRFIDHRFKPGVQVVESEVTQYYEKRFLVEARAKGVTPDPPLEEVRAAIEKILTEEKVNRLLDGWLKDTRSRTRIVYREKVYQ